MKKILFTILIGLISLCSFGQQFMSSGFVSTGDGVFMNGAGLAINGDTIDHVYVDGDSLLIETKGGQTFKTIRNPISIDQVPIEIDPLYAADSAEIFTHEDTLTILTTISMVNEAIETSIGNITSVDSSIYSQRSDTAFYLVNSYTLIDSVIYLSEYPVGNDTTGAGTAASPWHSLDKAVYHLTDYYVSNVTIQLDTGTYHISKLAFNRLLKIQPLGFYEIKILGHKEPFLTLTGKTQNPDTLFKFNFTNTFVPGELKGMHIEGYYDLPIADNGVDWLILPENKDSNVGSAVYSLASTVILDDADHVVANAFFQYGRGGLVMDAINFETQNIGKALRLGGVNPTCKWNFAGCNIRGLNVQNNNVLMNTCFIEVTKQGFQVNGYLSMIGRTVFEGDGGVGDNCLQTKEGGSIQLGNIIMQNFDGGLANQYGPTIFSDDGSGGGLMFRNVETAFRFNQGMQVHTAKWPQIILENVDYLYESYDTLAIIGAFDTTNIIGDPNISWVKNDNGQRVVPQYDYALFIKGVHDLDSITIPNLAYINEAIADHDSVLFSDTSTVALNISDVLYIMRGDTLTDKAYVDGLVNTDTNLYKHNEEVTFDESGPTIPWNSISLSESGQYQSAVGNGTYNIYRSIDFGKTWTTVGVLGGWQCIGVSSDGKYQSAGLNIGPIYGSSDYGATWSSISPISLLWRQIALSDDGKYQAAAPNGGPIYASSDYGATWSAVSISGNWKSIDVSQDGKYMAACIENGNIYNSDDYGQTWTSRASVLSWDGIAISDDGKYQSAIVYANGIHTSNDYGETWTFNSLNAGFQSISISSSGRMQMTCGSSNAFYKSFDYGETWELYSLTDGTMSSIDLSDNGLYYSMVNDGTGNIYSSNYEHFNLKPSMNYTSWLNDTSETSGLATKGWLLRKLSNIPTSSGGSSSGSLGDFQLSDGASGFIDATGIETLAGFNFDGYSFTASSGSGNGYIDYSLLDAGAYVDIFLSNGVDEFFNLYYDVSGFGIFADAGGPPLYYFSITEDGLEVDKGITLGTSSYEQAGTIQWTGTAFEGHDGISWNTLGGSSSFELPLHNRHDTIPALQFNDTIYLNAMQTSYQGVVVLSENTVLKYDHSLANWGTTSELVIDCNNYTLDFGEADTGISRYTLNTLAGVDNYMIFKQQNNYVAVNIWAQYYFDSEGPILQSAVIEYNTDTLVDLLFNEIVLFDSSGWTVSGDNQISIIGYGDSATIQPYLILSQAPSLDSTITVSYNSITGNSTDVNSNEIVSFNDSSVVNNAGGGVVQLYFPDQFNLDSIPTQPTKWYSTGAWNSTYGVAQTNLVGDGWVEVDYNFNADSLQFWYIGFDTVAFTSHSTVLDYGIRNTGGTGVTQITNSVVSSLNGTGPTASTTNLRIGRQGTTFYFQWSANNGDTWTTAHTYVPESSYDNFYINVSIQRPSYYIFNPTKY